MYFKGSEHIMNNYILALGLICIYLAKSIHQNGDYYISDYIGTHLMVEKKAGVRLNAKPFMQSSFTLTMYEDDIEDVSSSKNVLLEDSQTVDVLTNPPYQVHIEAHLLLKVGEKVKALGIKRIVILTDANVWSLYRDTLQNSLDDAIIDYTVLLLPVGEKAKTMVQYQRVITFLADHHFQRNDAVLAFGGGTVGDLAGFAAATYQRGMAFIQLPTTLLACVDASVGGKTAINLKQGKNLLGAFYQPKQVLCDWELFKTMSLNDFRNGVAEVIKYALLGRSELFIDLMTPLKQQDWRLTQIIYQCVYDKATIVATDERDYGERQLLNLGHTIGHAIEKCSQYKISHGDAVAIGMARIAQLSYRLNLIDRRTFTDIINCIDANGLPTKTTFSAAQLYAVSSNDKKRKDEVLTIVLICGIGNCFLKEITLKTWYTYLTMSLEEDVD